MGEIIRCTLLSKTASVPIKLSIGTLIAERVLDMLIMGSLVMLMFIIEFEKVVALISFISGQPAESVSSFVIGLGSIGALLFITLIIGYLFRKQLIQFKLFKTGEERLLSVIQEADRYPLLHKLIQLLSGIKDGLISIQKMSLRQQITYIGHTIVIWSMYYLMTYTLFQGGSATEHLSLTCAFTTFVMGGIGMVIPTPGGTGSYHFVVTQTLMAYGLTEGNAAAFAIVMHGAQSLSIIALGGLSMLIANHIPQQGSYRETLNQVVSEDTSNNV
ncbi:hypothetical protein GCM10023331_20860 [Algivirga pacifica]|uniref:TIGR00374 family protein n=2 Tax=Algivirga pacifica TaxID=1162670 RepID=A0ABP9DAY9_9BACT